MRSKTYSFFIAFFFSCALLLSACKTVSKLDDIKTIDDTLSVDTVILLDTIKGDTLLFNVDVVDNEFVIKQDTSLSDTTMTIDANDTIAPATQIKLDEKKSFVEDKIERSCNDSTIQDFKNNK